MNDTQINDFIIKIIKNIKTKESIFNLFSSYLSIDGFLELEGFYKFYFDIINSNILEKVLNSVNNDKIKKGLDIVWNHLHNFGYNNMLEKIKKYDFDYLQTHSDEFELCNKMNNFLKLCNKKIYKLSLKYNIEKIFFNYLNENEIFKKVKVIDISIFNFSKFIELNIILPNVTELTFYINKNLKNIII
jgi:hypothetical protein